MTLGVALAVLGTALPAYAPGTANAPAFDQASPQEVAAPGSNVPGPATAAPAPSSAVAPALSPGGPSPMGSAAVPSTARTDAQQPDNNAASAPPPPAGGSSGSGSEIEQATPAPQPDNSTTGYVAPGTPEAQVNPIPPTEGSAPPGPQTPAVRQVLVFGGLAVAALGLVVLLLIAYARRRIRSATPGLSSPRIAAFAERAGARRA